MTKANIIPLGVRIWPGPKIAWESLRLLLNTNDNSHKDKFCVLECNAQSFNRKGFGIGKTNSGRYKPSLPHQTEKDRQVINLHPFPAFQEEQLSTSFH